MRFEPPESDLRREQQAEREIGTTTVSPSLRKFLVVALLATLLAIPAADLAMSVRGGKHAPALFKDLGNLLVAPARALASAEGGWRERISRANDTFKSRAKELEESLKNDSSLSRTLLPTVQDWTAKHLRLGNEKVYLGRNGWLYYRPDFDHTAGAPFLAPREIHAKQMAQGIEADPRPAILALHRDLAARGIKLIVVPAPVKSSIEPEHLAGAPRSLPNASCKQFIDDLRREGVNVVDAGALLSAEKAKTGEPQFLRTDSHWTPQAMQRVAEEIARQLPPAAEKRQFRAGATLTVTNVGDLTRMLRLPEAQEKESMETAAITTVVAADGSPWKPGGEVLLLGDSFANIYSGGDLHWGEGAGLAEQISLASGRGVDRLVLNAGGASATRTALARDSGRLDGKAAVVYEFAARDLSSGDWKVIPLPQAARPESTPVRTGRTSGTIREITRVPERGSFPYDNVIVSLHLDTSEGEAVLFCFGLKDNAPAGAENLMPGDVIEADVIPWEEAEPRYGSICRRELESDAALVDTLYWAEEVPRRKH